VIAKLPSASIASASRTMLLAPDCSERIASTWAAGGSILATQPSKASGSGCVRIAVTAKPARPSAESHSPAP
jgi:hypothetical protein